jgi:hypothetical protein
MAKKLINIMIEVNGRVQNLDFSSRGSALPREEKSSVLLIVEN